MRNAAPADPQDRLGDRPAAAEGSEEIQMRKVGAFLFGYMGPRRREFANIGWDAVDYREEGQIRTNTPAL